jgi:hypothetical protein
MIERMDDVPAGVIGIRASGKLTKDDYESVLEPALKEAVETGEAKVLFVLPDFDGLEPDALFEDVKTGLSVELKDRSAWKRFAFETGVDWIAQSMRLFAWIVPRDVKVFDMSELDKAKEWVAT